MKVLSDVNLQQLLAVLAKQEEFVFFDTVRPDHENVTSLLFLNPVTRLQCRSGDDGRSFLAQIESALAAGYFVAGWFSYEFGYLLEERLGALLSRPGDDALLLAELGVFTKPCVFDHRTGRGDFPGLTSETAKKVTDSLSCQAQNIHLSLDRDTYIHAVHAIQRYIQAGDTYQVNYTLKLLFDFLGSPEALYALLRVNQSVAYGAYLCLGESRLLSFSPELFFKKDADSITVRPMKGTLRRGRFMAEDSEQARLLSEDPKNRSENVMIVDLLRNDLGRLMRDLGDAPVQVRSLFDVECYETLLQMTSTIVANTGGEKRGSLASLSLFSLFQALFPCGSVTGAPKIRTMEIIDELEPARRGVYTGAIGYLAPTGEALFNVPIRTVSLSGNHGEMGIGSGIVADSESEQEWQECLLKAGFLTSPAPAFQLIETLLWEPQSGYWLLDDHLERLSTSADYFLFNCDLPVISQRLHEESHQFKKQCTATPMRVRLTLAKDGFVVLASQPCSAPAVRRLPLSPDLHVVDMPRIELSPVRTDSSSSWFFHKTTRRELYNRELERVRAKGLFDCCFLNEHSELTEGCISNLILYRQGKYSTPSLHCGLLPGLMRMHLLADTQIILREEVLTLTDLRAAEAVFLCNSVRGIIHVKGNW